MSDVAEAIEEASRSPEGAHDRTSDAPADRPPASAPTDRPPASAPLTEGEASDAPADRPAVGATLTDGEALPLPGIVEALLFLSSEPLSPAELAEAAGTSEADVVSALRVLAEEYAPGRRGIRLRELGGGFTLASDSASEDAARRLFSRPRVSTLTPAQAETLAIVAYLQPVSRPEITRIRGVSADSAAATLLDRGLIEEAGHSQFGAILYRTSTQFLKLFGLRTLEELPDVARWDPTPEEQAELRERLLRAGEARLGGGAAGGAGGS
jgi:segregation and condensation protein B